MSSRPPIRVLHVVAMDALAGTELMVSSLILGSNPETARHELAVLQPPGPIVAGVRAGSRRASSLGGGRGGLAGAIWRLAGLLRSRPYDIVAAYGLKASVAARLLVRLLQPRAAFVCGVHGRFVTRVERLDAPKARLAALLERLLSPLVDAYDANSRAALEHLAELGIDRERLVHIPNGLDLSFWTPRDGDRGGERVPLIVCVANFMEPKRQEDLLHALAQLRGDGRRFRAVLAGSGPTLPTMRELASRLDLDSSVEFPGTVGTEQVRDLLAQAAIACLPSAWEGMPGSLMEAMASGVAVVATDVSGTNELVVEGESGLLVPAKDPAALAKALATLLDDRQMRLRLAAGGRRRMEERFSLNAMLDAKQRLYSEVASRAGQG